jgi:molecular chaperone GrpE
MFKSRPQPEPKETPKQSQSANVSENQDEASDQTQVQEIEMSVEAADLVKQLQSELDEAVEARKRALADFRNYQRRAAESEQRALQTGSTRVVRSILPVLDHFDLALMQKADQMTVEQLLNAVEIVRDEFNKALASQGVERIEPAQGEPFDPHRHEAVMRQPLAGAAPNTIVSTLQAGYAMGDLVLRPAKVSVAPGSEE